MSLARRGSPPARFSECIPPNEIVTCCPGGRNEALNHAAWTLGHWVAAGALDQAAAEEVLYAAAEQNGLVADDGPRQCWATIRSGLNTGLLPIDLDADR